MEKEWLAIISEVIEKEQEKIGGYPLEFPKGVTNDDLSKRVFLK